jgi:hypothetical protein
MALAEKNFDRMVRIDPTLYERTTVIAKFEDVNIKDFVALALREAIERREVKIVNTLAMLQKSTRAAAETATT